MFESILGNEKSKQILQKSMQNNTISHSYMFIGIEGIGKKIIAKEFAKNILCLKRNEKNFFTTYGKTGTPGRHMLYFLCKVRRKDGESGKNVFDFAEINGYNGRKRLKKSRFMGNRIRERKRWKGKSIGLLNTWQRRRERPETPRCLIGEIWSSWKNI